MEQVAPPEEKRLHSHWLVAFFIGIAVVCFLITGYLSYQYITRLRHRPHPIPRQTDVSLIQGWMTLPYIAHMYHVPEEELAQRLTIDPKTGRMQSLTKIATRDGKTVQEVIIVVQQTIRQFQSVRSMPSAIPSQ